MNEALLIFGMALVTYATRYPVLALLSRVSLPERAFNALRFVPPAVLSAIILPAILLRDGELTLRLNNAPLVAGIFAALVAWRTKNLLLTIVLGMLALWAWRWVMGV